MKRAEYIRTTADAMRNRYDDDFICIHQIAKFIHRDDAVVRKMMIGAKTHGGRGSRFLTDEVAERIYDNGEIYTGGETK